MAMKPILSDERIRGIASEYNMLSAYSIVDPETQKQRFYTAIECAIKQVLYEQSNVVVDWLEKEADRLEEKYFASAATYRAIAKQLAE